MYVPVTTEDFDTWIKAESRTFETRCDVIIGNTTYRLSGSGLGGDIISMQWNNVVCSNDGLQIGTSCMDEFRMEYRNNNSIPSLMNSEIHPYVGLVIPHENTGDVTVWIPLGVFYVTNTESNDEDRTFSVTAYDGMQRLMGNINWTALQVEFPINAWTLLQTIANYFNLTITYDELTYQLLSSDDYILTTSDGYNLVVGAEINANKNVSFDKGYEGTYRDYIGWIAGLVGANAHMGRTGDLVISRYTDHGMTIPRTLQHMGGTKINFGGSVTYTNIVSGTDENPVYATDYTGNAITYTNPYITVTELDRVCDELIGESGMTITPCDIQWRGDPRLDCGDIVQAEDKDGNYFPVYVMERVMNITGGLSETLHCYVETEVQKVLNKSPIVTKMTQIAKNSELSPAYIINNTEGTFQFIDNGDGTNGGFTIYESDGVAFLRCTAGGIGLSQDGGLTYTNAITKNGVVATELSVTKSGVELLNAGVSGTTSQLLMRSTSGTQVLGISAGSSSVELSLTEPSTGNYAFRVMSYINSATNQPYFTMLARHNNGNNMMLMETYRLTYTSGAYDDIASTTFYNPFNQRSIFRLYSSQNSGGGSYTGATFGSDLDGYGMSEVGNGTFRVNFRSGTRVYFIEFFATSSNSGINVGYKNDDGTQSYYTLTPHTLSVGGATRTILST